MTSKMIIRLMTKRDWKQVSNIYKQGLDTGNATFQQIVPSWEEWDSGHLNKCRLVAEMNDEVIGWAALSEVSSRCVYGGVAEVSIYISANHGGMGVGSKLMDALIAESENVGMWTLQAGIFPENIASIKLHKNYGFREVGYREKIGKMNGVWRNTVLLERRSKK